MKKILSTLNKKISLPIFHNFDKAVKTFSITEKFILGVALTVLICSTLFILYRVNESFLIEIPREGGELNEGLIGTPRLINPILAISETDKDLVSLIYSGLMRVASGNQLETNLAESYEISEDGLEYKFTLKENITFHDGTEITTDDVIFTILSAQNPELKSPKRSNWEGISVEKISDKEMIFRLKQPYAPFLNNLTIGILPKHIWEEIDINEFNLSIFNTEPIGSGPYQIKKITKDKIGIPQIYSLESFSNFALGEPHIKNINFYFVKNQDELMAKYMSKEVESIHGIDPETAKLLEQQGARVEKFPLPRIFGIFFNQDQATVLSSNRVRSALELATPKNLIVENVLQGYGSIIDSPVPNYLIESDESDLRSLEERIAEAEEILTDAGWERNEEGIMISETDDEMRMLSFSIATANVPELVEAAEIVAENWRKIGADVRVEKYETTDLNPNVIRPRNYDALLFGMVIGRDFDFYAFWHSSQRNDPGLNISKYANIDVDAILEDLRVADEPEVINDLLGQFKAEIQKDIPAIFLYTPEFIYVLPYKVSGVSLNNITSAEERFLNIHEWYVSTDKIWKIFNKD